MRSFLIISTLGLVSVFVASEKATASTILGSAESVAVLGNSTVTNTGPTTINGDLDLSPGTSITGQASITVIGTTNIANGAAQQAQTNAATAYSTLKSLASTENLSGTDLGGLTLMPGVYTFGESAGLSGTLTLNFNGVSNADIVFQIGSTLTTASSSTVTVEGGNSNDGVFFEVGSSATLGTGTIFAGNILAMDSITLNSASEILCGRAIALTAAVTMDTNTISNNCLANGNSDFGSVGFSGGDFTKLGYTGGGFDGVPPGQQVAPSPEASTFALFGLGLMGLSFVQFRRNASGATATLQPVKAVEHFRGIHR
jgi:hypothetical protein